MNKKIMAITCGIMIMFVASACKKKEEEAPVIPKSVMPGQHQNVTPEGHQQMMPTGETTVVVPDSVKGEWKGVVLVIEDKEAGKTTEFTVDLHSEFKLPDSNITITVGDFLPDFRMDGRTITSLSNEANNPAIAIKISEDDKQIFPQPGKKWGWLYAKPELRSVHPFEHAKYGISLKNGIKEG